MSRGAIVRAGEGRASAWPARQVQSMLRLVRGGRSDQWRHDLSGVVADLRDMNRSTETDFLRVGERLLGFSTIIREIRDEIGRLVGSISGEAGDRACRALTAVIDRVSGMQGELERTGRQLDALPAVVNRARHGFAGFDAVVMSFHVVSTLSKIETARLGSSQPDFGNLSEDIRTCTEKVQDRVEQALHEASGLDRSVDAAIRRMSALDVRQLTQIPAVVSALQQSLDALRRRQEQAAAASAKLDERFQAFSHAIGRIVTGLQFHDITRQQVEHVEEALVGILDHEEPAKATYSPDRMVVEMQNLQLASALDTFKTSVDDILKQLHVISREVEEMADASRDLIGLAENGGGRTFFDEMEQSYHVITNALSTWLQTDVEVRRAGTELQTMVNGLSGCLNDIRSTDIEISRLALNATIRAVHLGRAGEPLHVVASAMQRLHADADERCDVTGQALQAVGRVLTAIAAREDQGANAAGGEGDAALVELRASVGGLREAGERAAASCKRISASAIALCDEVREVAQKFSVGALVEQTVVRSRDALERVAADAVSRPADNLSASAHVDLAATRYTMQSERDIHHAVAGTVGSSGVRPEPPFDAGASEAAPAAPPVAEEDSSFGDNVELF